MKKYYSILVLVLAFSSFQLPAQTFAPEGSFWNYSCDIGFGSCLTEKTILVTNDTIENGYVTKYLSQTRIAYNNFPNCFYSQTTGNFGVMQIRNDSVFIGSNLTLMEYKFAFNMNVGHILSLGDYSQLNRIYYAIVDSISSVTVNGYNLTKWILSKHCVTPPGFTPFDSSSHGLLTIIDKIGPVDDFIFFNPDGCGAVGWDVDYCDLTCYKSDSLEYGAIPCNPLILSIGNTDNPRNLIQLKPNPFTGELTIELLDYKKPGKLRIYGLLGNIVYESTLIQRKQNIDLSHLLTGVYLAHITLDENTVHKKIIKH